MDFKAITWSPEQEQIIYREWGVFYSKKQNLDVADLYYNRSLALNPDDSKALFLRSRCKRHIAQTAGGLTDAERSLSIDPLSQPINLEVCDGIYELNEFEKAACHLTNYSRKFYGKKVDAFRDRLSYVEENFNDTLGNTLGYFILENESVLQTVHKLMRSVPDTRPLWKILKEQAACDVLSVLEKEVIHLRPREIARRRRAYSIFNQIYLQRSWNDELFLKSLRSHPDLLLPQSNLSRPILEKLINTKYYIVETLLRMLHARCPLYTKERLNCPNRKRKIMAREKFLFRTQHQVHRSMLKMLQMMKELRSSGQLEKLRVYVEEVMGDFVVLKTHRVMPWKFVFLNEVYNILALAICDKLVYIREQPGSEPLELMALLKMKKQTENENAPFEFGKKAAQADLADKEVLKLKAFTARLIRRLRFAKHPIERAYLWYEFARTELKQNAFDRCCVLAEKCIAGEAVLCNSNLWQLHGLMMIVRAHAMLRKIEKIRATLSLALQLIPKLGNDRITEFLNKCMRQNSRDIYEKIRAERLRRIQMSSQTSLKKK